MVNREYTSIELFAGAGGLALGLEKAGLHHIALNEFDKFACQTLRANRPNWNVLEGDIHDIGKNLVALMLKNHGFHVIDLGKDVPKETIIAAAKEHNAKFIALSALMTTTMQRMREVVEAAKAEGLDAKIMIGGAVITQEYADEIGADGYSKDAADAVKLAKRLNQ